ncbi:MAG: hypothetical protein WDN75_14730 [Bacteroidota bacterium]
MRDDVQAQVAALWPQATTERPSCNWRPGRIQERFL